MSFDTSVHKFFEFMQKHIIKFLFFFTSRKQKGPARNKRHFSPDFMKMVCKSNVFLYPLLLPEKPFSGYIETIRRKELTKSEEWLVRNILFIFFLFVSMLDLIA